LTSLTALMGKSPARIGAVLALASLPVHLVIAEAVSYQLAAIVLTLIARIYVGFALQDGRPVALATEAAVALGFASAALAGLVVNHWVIPFTYLLHGVWDIAHHRRIETAMPRWYIPFCTVFDWVFTAGLTAIWTLR